MDHIDCIVAGAGVVGLAIARSLAMNGRDVLVVEAENRIGSQTSSRNSEVIHAGLYYKSGSLKASHCLEGKERLYHYARKNSVPHRQCGKLIVATRTADEAKLAAILSNASLCGVDDLEVMEGAAARRLEPALSATSALLSPSTGIIDSHAFMLAMLADIENAGSQIVYTTRIESAYRQGERLVLRAAQTGKPDVFEFSTAIFVNATGLAAQSVAGKIEGLPKNRIPPLRLAKGNYFSPSGPSPFTRLIYPVPDDEGLGVHLTFDMDGQMRFGPDVEWVEAVDYAVDPQRSQAFYAEIRRYWPQLPDHSLEPAYCGIRPKLSAPGEPAADFVIDGPSGHGVPGLINLFGIESPGLTASLSIAEAVRELTR